MEKYEDIRDISDCLDETIEKAESIDTIKKAESVDTKKSFSHDPFQPVDMSNNENYYNPYARADDGGFYPHTAQHWHQQIKSKEFSDSAEYQDPAKLSPSYMEAYRENNRFYKLAGISLKSLYDHDLIKAAALPVGTIHTYNGVRFQKMAEGNWQPVPMKQGATGKPHPLEHHAIKDRIEKITKVLDKRDEFRSKPVSTVETAKGKNTSETHKGKTGKYSPERKKLHEQIFSHFSDHVEPDKKGRPVAILTGGGSGSGKSSMLQEVMKGLNTEAVHIDSDEIKKHIPEYNEKLKNGDEDAANHVHDESSDLSSELISRSVKDRKSLIYDSTMKNQEKMSKLIQHLKDQGYIVHLAYADVPKETALKRAQARADRTGRKIPEDVFHSSHDGAIKSLGAIANDAHSVSVYNTEAEGKPPRQVYARFGSRKMVDSNAHQEMIARGHTIKSMFKGGFGSGRREGMHPLIKKFMDAMKKSKVKISDKDIAHIQDDGVSHDQYSSKEKNDVVKK